MKKEQPYERYQRQLLLKEFGLAGQQKLLAAKVLVIGAGGLGCPVLQYLAAAGAGVIGIADDDVVELTNLHRQPLYTVNDIGFPKAVTAREKLLQLNPDVQITAYHERLTVFNALHIIEQYDVVIDGTDNFASRYLINDACVLLGRPLVYGAVSKFEGQVAVFNANSAAVNYRDLFPNPPKNNEAPNCAEAGVLGVLPGIIGTMMANEIIKLVTGTGAPLINKMLTYNALNNQVYELALNTRAETRSLIPGSMEAFQQMNYEWFCASPAAGEFEIDAAAFSALLHENDITIIDVREFDESPAVKEFTHIQIPLPQLNDKLDAVKAGTVITFCQSGGRSLQAARLLFDTFGTSKKIYSLRGGILQWKKQQAQFI